MDAREIAQAAQAAAAANPTQQTQDRDPLAPYNVQGSEQDLPGGHGTFVFGTRKSNGVHVLVYVPSSRKRAQAVPVTAILEAGFVPAEPDPQPEPTPAPKRKRSTKS